MKLNKYRSFFFLVASFQGLSCSLLHESKHPRSCKVHDYIVCEKISATPDEKNNFDVIGGNTDIESHILGINYQHMRYFCSISPSYAIANDLEPRMSLELVYVPEWFHAEMVKHARGHDGVSNLIVKNSLVCRDTVILQDVRNAMFKEVSTKHSSEDTQEAPVMTDSVPQDNNIIEWEHHKVARSSLKHGRFLQQALVSQSSATPTSTCVDDSSFWFLLDNGNNRTCDWIKRANPQKRILKYCDRTHVKYGCPHTCLKSRENPLPCECPDDDEAFQFSLFELTNETRKCEWISQGAETLDARRSTYCYFENNTATLIGEKCIRSCGFCRGELQSTVPPSMLPSHIPTLLLLTSTQSPSIRTSPSSSNKSSKSTKCLDKSKKSCSPSSKPSVIPSSNPSDFPSYQPTRQPSDQPSVCQDEPGWVVGGTSKFSGMNCTDIRGNINGWCELIQGLNDTQYAGKSIREACCDCGGGDHQTIFPSVSPTEHPSVSQEPSYHEFPSTPPSLQPSECRNEPGWHFKANMSDGTLVEVTCEWLGDNDHLCQQFRDFFFDAKNVFLACCICGGGDHVSVHPSDSPSELPSVKPSTLPSLSIKPSYVPTGLPSDSPTDSPSNEPSHEPSSSSKPSNFPSLPFGTAFDGDPCNYDSECKERPLFPTATHADEKCYLLKRRLPTPSPTVLNARSLSVINFELSEKRHMRAEAATSSLNSVPSKPSEFIHKRQVSFTRRVQSSQKSPKSEKCSRGKGYSCSPTSVPSSAPSTLPTVYPSNNPSSHPSVSPSILPSDEPSLKPSSVPSDFPSLEPSDEPSMNPSEVPSTRPSSYPSTEPSLMPSAKPSETPTNNPSSIPSISLIPSMKPTPSRQSGVCNINKVCEAEDLVLSFCRPSNSITAPTAAPGSTGTPTLTTICTDDSISAKYTGSYGNGSKDGTYDQDFTGGVVVGPSRTITMFGNAWKVYELEKYYTVTEVSKLEFDFYMFNEAEGHAICVDDDINEDTFGGERIRCFMVAGKQFHSWDHVLKLNLNDTEQIRPGQVPNRNKLCYAEERITVSLKDLFRDQLTEIKYIAFIQDNDESPTSGESAFENIVLYEDDIQPGQEQLKGEWVQDGYSCYNHFQGGNSAYQETNRSSGGKSIWLVAYQNNTIGVGEIRTAPYRNLSRLCEGKPGMSDFSSNYQMFADETGLESSEERRFSIAKDGTLVVGYPNHQYTHPSSEPSSLVTDTPTRAPTLAPDAVVKTIQQSFGRALRVADTEINGSDSHYGVDHFGHVVIYVLSGLLSGDWKNNDKFVFYGPSTDDKLGDCVCISADGKFVAISSPAHDAGNGNTGMVSIYERKSSVDNIWRQVGTSLTGIDVSDRQVQNNFGKKVGLSSDGSLAVIASDAKAFVFFLTDDGTSIGSTYKEIPLASFIDFSSITLNNFDGGAAVDIVNSAVIIRGKDDEGRTAALKLELSCLDKNALPNSDSSNPFDNVECVCNDGFVSSSSSGISTVLKNNEFCVPVMASGNIDATHDTILIKFSSEIGVIQKDDFHIFRTDPDGDVNLTSMLADNQFAFNTGETTNTVVISKLRPGYRYTILFPSLRGVTKALRLVAVTSCSCDDSKIDDTGRPHDFTISQDHGHVTFTFRDNSYCEQAFSFTRVDKVEEFLLDFAESAGSFVSDFYFSAAEDCNTIISPEREASDNLSVSKLFVGKKYSYCVRAVGEPHYMDAPFSLSTERRLLTSSLSSCDAHYIHWEASIHGKVTTLLNTGGLPIEDTIIRWELLDKDNHSRVLVCDNCSGLAISDDGGLFRIHIKALESSLDNISGIPVRLFFEKKSPGDIEHVFLCDDGETLCPESGYIIYLNHLTFEAPLHVFDDTSIPFSGKVTIADTNGCPLSDVTVCAMYNDPLSGIAEEINCVETDVDGIYKIPIVLGSRVDYLNFAYYEHVFEQVSADKNFTGGILITTEDAPYVDYDFQDVTKGKLRVEVAGGKCNVQLGKSSVSISVAGCDWEPEPFTQSGWTKDYWDLPAQILHVEVVDIIDRSSNQTILPIWMEFQGTNPIIRAIDLRETQVSDVVEETDLSVNTTTGTEDETEQEEAEAAMHHLEEDAEEKLHTVRFQYDGTLGMRVEIKSSDDQLRCNKFDANEYDGADSLHVIEYMSIFQVNVYLQYEILDGLYCDIVEDSVQVEVTNNVGYDNYSGYEEFKNSIPSGFNDLLLQLCNPLFEGPCYYPVIHDTDDEANNIGNARLIDLQFATGRPNIVAPFTKSMIFRVIGVDTDVQYKAAFFINGLYSKGPGESFALPTHEPIMILRDPPGGLSTAKYENVVTTMKLKTSENHISMKLSLGISAEAKVQLKTKLCKGAGFGFAGAGFNECSDPAELDQNVEFLNLSSKTGPDLLHNIQEYSNSFSTTWSFETSDDPWTAGKTSDVFVVPNLNVEVQEVYEVYWDNARCEPLFPFPSRVVFNLQANEQALAFYSRYHIATDKLPTMEAALKIQKELLDAAKRNEKVCCPAVENERCTPEEKTVCSREEIDSIQEEVDVLSSSIKSWNTFLSKMPEKESLSNYMRGPGFRIDDMNKDQELAVDFSGDVESSVTSGIVPETLISSAKKLEDTNLDNVSKNNDGAILGFGDAKRIQISGGGTLYELTLKKDTEDGLTKCRGACKVKHESSFSPPQKKKSAAGVFGTGVSVEVDPVSIIVETEHSWNKQTTNTKETSVSIKLGDADPGDEFVVDLFYDKDYGTVVFETVSGKSRCPQEINTLPIEDPGIEITTFPSQFVYPDDAMIFELKLSNLGVGSESLLALYPQDNDNEANLAIFVDGDTLFSSRVYFSMYKDTSYRKFVAVSRGNLYVNKPVTLTLESACMDAASSVNDVTVATFTGEDWQSTIPNSKSITLYNAISGDGAPIIKFLEPCPKIYWAGPLSRDRKFLINSKSPEEERRGSMDVTIFNPNFGTSSLKDMKSDRLEHVFMMYRKVGGGEADWNPALIQLFDGAVQLDFTEDYALEDAYGYITLDWAHGGKEGSYEIMVESKCSNLGGPDDFNNFRDVILSGVIDLTPPELYGEVLPLKNEILLGEQVLIPFTEPLDCSRPFSFEIEVMVLNTNFRFDNDNLHVICEGRTIGFNFDPGEVMNPELLLGQTFQVTLGSINPQYSKNVRDTNGNELKSNIAFQRSFVATQNLNAASTSFGIRARLLENNSCTNETKSILSDAIKSDLVSLLEITNSSQIIVNEVIDEYCIEGSRDIDLKMTILPSHEHSHELHNHPHALLHKLKRYTESDIISSNKRRKLSTISMFSIRDMQFHPSDVDIKRYLTPGNIRERERHILHDLSMFNYQSEEIPPIPNFDEILRRIEQNMIEEKNKDLKMLEMKLLLSGIIIAASMFTCGALLVYLIYVKPGQGPPKESPKI